VIDLSQAADQPFVCDDGRLALVYNGEIYNFRELRRDLDARGHSFRTTSDTEVIARLYLEGGPTALDRLDGMFAFALWDGRRNGLVLMRDRLGQKPLHYTQTSDGAVAFASEIKALEAVPGFHSEPDWALLPELLTFGYVGTPRSFVRGVHRVPPAHRLEWTDAEGPRFARYWSLPEPGLPPITRSVPEATSLVRSHVRAAVRRRLVADVPMGAFLSGGIDSSVVVAEMAEATTSPVQSFAAGFPDDASFDETPAAKQVAELFGLDHRELHVRLSPLDLLEKLLWHHDEPYGDSSGVALFGISELTRQHVTVVLSGDGGDELFGGYTRFLGGLLPIGPLNPALRVAGRGLEKLPEAGGYKHPLTLARRLTEHAGRSPDEQLLAWNAFFAGPALTRLLRPEAVGADFDPWPVMQPQLRLFREAAAAGADRLDQVLRHNLATYLLDDLLVKADRMTMAWGLEARSPFLDKDLVELCFRLPSSMKIRGTSLKWILKKAYEGVLPHDILHRKKHGFGVPVSRWWRSGEGRALVHDLLLGDGAHSKEVLQPGEVRRLVQAHESGRRDHGQRIFLLLQLEMWLRRQRRTPRTLAVGDPPSSYAS
jgi:asparagine synthase (glutamine-hydrolysing)